LLTLQSALLLPVLVRVSALDRGCLSRFAGLLRSLLPLTFFLQPGVVLSLLLFLFRLPSVPTWALLHTIANRGARRGVTKAAPFASRQGLELPRSIGLDRVAGLANCHRTKIPVAQILGANRHRTSDLRRSRENPWLNVERSNRAPYVGGNQSGRYTAINGDAGTIVHENSLVHYDRLADIDRILRPRQKNLRQAGSDYKITCSHEYPGIGPIAIFNDYFRRR